MKALTSLFIAGILPCIAARPLHASTWDGGASHAGFSVNDLWSTANNWSDGIPVSSPTTDVAFGFSTVRTTATQNLATPFFLRSLTNLPNSNVTAVTGNALSFSSNATIAQNSAVALTIGSQIVLNGALVVTGTGVAPLSLVAPLSGPGAVRYAGGAGGVRILVNVAGANSFSGGTYIGSDLAGFSPAEVTMFSDTAGGTGTINLFNGNTIRAANGARIFANPLGLFLNGNGLNDVFTFGAGDNMTFNGAINVSGAQKTLQVDNALTTFGGNITGTAPLVKTGPGTLALAGSNTAATGGWTINSGALRLANAAAIGSGPVTLNANNGIDFNGQTNVAFPSFAGAGNLNLGAATLTVGSANLSTTYSGTLSSNSPAAGVFKKVGTGTLTLSGQGSALASFGVENGGLRLLGSTMSLDGGFNVGGTAATATATMSNQATLSCGASGGSVIAGGPGTALTLDEAGTAANVGFQIVVSIDAGSGLSNGLLTVKNGAALSGTFIVVGAGNASGVGTASIESGGTVNCAGGIIGFINNSVGVATVTGAGSHWHNESSLGIGGFNTDQLGGKGTLIIANNGLVTVGGTTAFWTNGGKVDVQGGQLLTDMLITNAPTDAVIALSDPDEISSALVVGGSGGTSTFPGTITNGTTGPGGIQKIGAGTLTLTGPLGYTGFTRVSGGKLVVPQSYQFATITSIASGSTLEFTGTWGTNAFSQTTIAPGGKLTASGTLRGTVTNTGTVELSGAKTLTMTGSVVNDGVMRFKSGAALTATGSFVNNGVIDIITGTFTPPPGFVNHGVIIDRKSVITSITKADTLVTISSPKLFGGHQYQLQTADAPDTAFTSIGLSFFLPTDQPLSTNLGEIIPQRFYRWKVD